jgi:hypothetical protein
MHPTTLDHLLNASSSASAACALIDKARHDLAVSSPKLYALSVEIVARLQEALTNACEIRRLTAPREHDPLTAVP